MGSSGGASLSKHSGLYNAAVKGDWETAKTAFFDKDKDATIAIISFDKETALHVAALSGKANDFVRNLVGLMRSEDVAIRDRYGYTALHSAAKVGNTEAAMALVEKNQDLLYMLSDGGLLPVTVAAAYCQKDTLQYLLSVSRPHVMHTPFEGSLGVGLLISIIGCEFFDVALDLVEKYPDLARLRCGNGGRCALSFVAEMDTVFASRECFSWWETLIYRRIHIPLRRPEGKASKATDVSDIEKVISDPPANKKSTPFRICSAVANKSESIIWKIMERLSVPQVEEMREKKTKHKQALELVIYLCQEMASLPENEGWSMIGDAIIRAAKHGISEIVELFMEMYPVVTDYADGSGRNIMHLAATNRFENVFNLTFIMSDRKHLFSNGVDNKGNNLMHMCGKLAPPDRLNLVPGAALQMQRELQWFKEMENFIPPSCRKWVNSEGKTPKMLFTEEHQELKTEGERWMKDTSNACTIAAALIATVVFAAAFTLPGGLVSETGLPVFLNKQTFILFAVTNAISLFTSITSLLMFLSILNSRYAEEDFLYVLPKRLSIGLLSLFVSITFMLVAFSAALYLEFCRQIAWFLIPVAAFAWLPVTSFVLLQFPLLADVVYSTYGPGIFGKKSDRLLY